MDETTSIYVSFSEILSTFPKTDFTKKASVFFRYVNNVGLKNKNKNTINWEGCEENQENKCEK